MGNIYPIKKEFNPILQADPFNLPLFQKQQRLNTSVHRHYSSYYDQQMIDKIQHKDRIIFELFYHHNTTIQRSCFPDRPWISEILSRRAQAYLANGEIDRAVQQFTEAVDLDPGYWPAYNHLGTIYRHQHKMDKALATFQRAIDIHPNDPDMVLNCGGILEYLGHKADARSLYGVYLDRHSDNSDVMIRYQHCMG